MFNLKSLKNGKNEIEQLKKLQAELSDSENERSVKEWNNLRENAKKHYSKEVISMLDASGFINEWIKQ